MKILVQVYENNEDRPTYQFASFSISEAEQVIGRLRGLLTGRLIEDAHKDMLV